MKITIEINSLDYQSLNSSARIISLLKRSLKKKGGAKPMVDDNLTDKPDDKEETPDDEENKPEDENKETGEGEPSTPSSPA